MTAAEVERHGQRAEIFRAEPGLPVYGLPTQIHLAHGFFTKPLANREQPPLILARKHKLRKIVDYPLKRIYSDNSELNTGVLL